MTRLQQRTSDECHDRHNATPVRVYADDAVQKGRIERARNLVVAMLLDWNQTASHAWAKIIELGCGTGDISGHFSWGHHSKGYESSVNSAVECAQRWKWMEVRGGDIQKLEAEECDLVVMCEILEHTADPESIVSRWLPKAKYSLISFPIDGDLEGDLSAGEHCWSFTVDDFKRFFALGGHAILHAEVFQMGGYNIGIGMGKLMPSPAE